MQRFIIRNNEIKHNAMAAISALSSDTVHEVEIKKPNRSRSQNNLYWSWLSILADWTGYTKDEMHTFLAVSFLGQETIQVNGHSITVARSTRNLKVNEFSDYLIEIEAWAHEHGIVLPHPADYQLAIGGKLKSEYEQGNGVARLPVASGPSLGEARESPGIYSGGAR